MDNEILIPKLGWSIDEATFVEWLKSNGEYINTGDEIFSVESEKAVQVVESIDSGWLSIDNDLPKEGQILKSGTVIGYLTEKKSSEEVNIKLESFAGPELDKVNKNREDTNKNGIKDLDSKNKITEEKNKTDSSEKIFISPRARSLAKKLKINSFSDINGTGKNNRITEKDINLFYKNYNSKTINVNSLNILNLTINCSKLLDFKNLYDEPSKNLNFRMIDYLIKIFGHAFQSNKKDNEININQVCLINNDNEKESFFVSNPKNKGLLEIGEMTQKHNANSKIDKSTIVLIDLTEYNIQFFNPKIISPSLLSIGVGKYLSDISEVFYTLNFCYINEYEPSLLKKIKLIPEYTKSPYRLLL